MKRRNRRWIDNDVRSRQDQHLPKKEQRAQAWSALSRLSKLRIVVWGWFAHYAEAKWLTANGWTQVRNGWLLPVWHPTRSKVRVRTARVPVADLTVNIHEYEPYDQKHAANSQRYHMGVEQRPPPKIKLRLPDYPAYVRWAPYSLAIFGLTWATGTGALASQGWVRWSFCVACTLFAFVGFVIAWQVQRDLELDYVEEKLRGKR